MIQKYAKYLPLFDYMGGKDSMAAALVLDALIELYQSFYFRTNHATLKPEKDPKSEFKTTFDPFSSPPVAVGTGTILPADLVVVFNALREYIYFKYDNVMPASLPAKLLINTTPPYTHDDISKMDTVDLRFTTFITYFHYNIQDPDYVKRHNALIRTILGDNKDYLQSFFGLVFNVSALSITIHPNFKRFAYNPSQILQNILTSQVHFNVLTTVALGNTNKINPKLIKYLAKYLSSFGSTGGRANDNARESVSLIKPQPKAGDDDYMFFTNLTNGKSGVAGTATTTPAHVRAAIDQLAADRIISAACQTKMKSEAASKIATDFSEANIIKFLTSFTTTNVGEEFITFSTTQYEKKMKELFGRNNYFFPINYTGYIIKLRSRQTHVSKDHSSMLDQPLDVFPTVPTPIYFLDAKNILKKLENENEEEVVNTDTNNCDMTFFNTGVPNFKCAEFLTECLYTNQEDKIEQCKRFFLDHTFFDVASEEILTMPMDVIRKVLEVFGFETETQDSVIPGTSFKITKYETFDKWLDKLKSNGKLTDTDVTTIKNNNKLKSYLDGVVGKANKNFTFTALKSGNHQESQLIKNQLIKFLGLQQQPQAPDSSRPQLLMMFRPLAGGGIDDGAEIYDSLHHLNDIMEDTKENFELFQQVAGSNSIDKIRSFLLTTGDDMGLSKKSNTRTSSIISKIFTLLINYLKQNNQQLKPADVEVINKKIKELHDVENAHIERMLYIAAYVQSLTDGTLKDSEKKKSTQDFNNMVKLVNESGNLRKGIDKKSGRLQKTLVYLLGMASPIPLPLPMP